jgi:hypothetical protein
VHNHPGIEALSFTPASKDRLLGTPNVAGYHAKPACNSTSARFQRLIQRIEPRPENLRPIGACTSVGSPRRTGPALEKLSTPVQTCCRFRPRLLS